MKKIKVTCYNEIYWFDSKKEAIKYFERGMRSCDTFSSEWIRYADIVDRLKDGCTDVSDEYFNYRSFKY